MGRSAIRLLKAASRNPSYDVPPWAGVFDNAAMQAAWKWRLDPPMENGKAVAGRVRVPVTFEAGKAGGNAAPKA